MAPFDVLQWRTNGKNNLWTINTLYAYGYGFRANYPFPSIEEQKKDNAVFFRLFKRDLFSKLETALDGYVFYCYFYLFAFSVYY